MTGMTCAGTWVTGTGKDGTPARGLPVPRGRQRVVHGGVRLAGRGLADRGQPGGGAGADGLGRVVRRRRARPGGPAARAVPGPADRLRFTLGLRERTPARLKHHSPTRTETPNGGPWWKNCATSSAVSGRTPRSTGGPS